MGNRAAQPLPNTRGKLGPDKAGVVVPDSMKKDEYQSIINQLPDVDEPSLFGLPPNIERVVQQANSAKITSQLKTMATADVAASGWDRERMAAQMDPKLAIDAWLERAVGGATLQDAVSLSAMFNPGVFLNALRQQTARVSSVAVDDLKLVCQWGEAGRSGVGKLPCAISGLALQGALFTSGSNLADSRLDTPTVVGIPQCTIAYIPKKDEDPIPDKSSVELPVYDGLDRAKFLCQLRMPCKAGEQDKWVMCGAAIFLSTE
ncbi:hypothetical protein T484DRAFT_3433439 [Baffinella frigidus]|nr:hypothetical protein T484DRAFT_3433439 [Cryptophyta sp. CCMP2293]